MQEPEGFGEFVPARSPARLCAAWLLTGNRATAQDLVQAALARAWTRWARLDRTDNQEAECSAGAAARAGRVSSS